MHIVKLSKNEWVNLDHVCHAYITGNGDKRPGDLLLVTTAAQAAGVASDDWTTEAYEVRVRGDDIPIVTTQLDLMDDVARLRG